VREYKQTYDSGQRHLGSMRGEDQVTHTISHKIANYTARGEDLYITTKFDLTVTGSAARLFYTVVSTQADSDGVAEEHGSSEILKAAEGIDGENESALRAYHLSIVEDYASEPARRTFPAST
jgi:hypothetical protein